MKLYAWVGEDEHHNGEGLKMVVTPLGTQNAVFATEKLATADWVLWQMQRIADTVNRPMRLIIVQEAACRTRLTPNPQG